MVLLFAPATYRVLFALTVAWGFLIGDRDMKYTIERDSVHRCYVVVDENGGYLPNTYESKEECLAAILENEGVEVEGL